MVEVHELACTLSPLQEPPMSQLVSQSPQTQHEHQAAAEVRPATPSQRGPQVLDAAQLKQVSGGGPKGGWIIPEGASTADGPKGGW
jgi:hypothetical protein